MFLLCLGFGKPQSSNKVFVPIQMSRYSGSKRHRNTRCVRRASLRKHTPPGGKTQRSRACVQSEGADTTSPTGQLHWHPVSCSRTFSMHADTPHRTSQLHGLPQCPDCSMSHSLHGTPWTGRPVQQPRRPVVVCTKPKHVLLLCQKEAASDTKNTKFQGEMSGGIPRGGRCDVTRALRGRVCQATSTLHVEARGDTPQLSPVKSYVCSFASQQRMAGSEVRLWLRHSHWACSIRALNTRRCVHPGANTSQRI